MGIQELKLIPESSLSRRWQILNKMDAKKQELLDSIFKALIRIEDKGIESIYYRRSFLVNIFTITLASFAGLLAVDLNIQFNMWSIAGLILILPNLFLIPYYTWSDLRKELKILGERNDLLNEAQITVMKNGVITEEQQKRFTVLFDNKKTGSYIDWVFDVIIWTFIIGLLVFVISSSRQFFLNNL
jgi:uncharacterized membrane protein (DUF373 family)